jgi:hypothetical protein
MGEVELPLVDAATTLENALKVMKAAQRSGLVTILNGHLTVFELGQVVDELREQGDQPLSKLSPAKRTRMFSLREPAALARGTGGISRPSFAGRAPLPAIEAFAGSDAKQAGFDYVVPAGHGGNLISVVTQSESLQMRLEAPPVLCECAVGHRYTPEQTQARNNKCTKCLDSKPIVCDGGT